MYFHAYMESVIGTLVLIKNEECLVYISLFADEHEAAVAKYESQLFTAIFEEEMKQFREYFSGERTSFDLQVDYQGTTFQKQVWQELMKIPYGETRSYLEIARAIDRPKAVRAVGQANKRNRLPLIIPCHRVIGSSTKLIGFGGAHTDIQALLLQLEKRL